MELQLQLSESIDKDGPHWKILKMAGKWENRQQREMGDGEYEGGDGGV